MHTFKEFFINENARDSQNFEDRVRAVVTNEPYNFTWNHAIDREESKARRGTLVAYREIPEKYRNYMNARGFSMHIDIWNKIVMHFPAVLLAVDSVAFPFEFAGSMALDFSHLEPSTTSDEPKKIKISTCFEIYNYYLSLEGIPEDERRIRMVDRFLFFWRRMWTSVVDARYAPLGRLIFSSGRGRYLVMNLYLPMIGLT